MVDEKIEKPVNNSLKDFLGTEAPKAKGKVPMPPVATDGDDDFEDIVDSDDMEIPLMDKDFKPVISDVSPQQKAEERGVKAKVGQVDGKVLTVAAVEFGMPKTKELVDGSYVPIVPKETLKSKAKFYEAKLKIRFVEDNLAEWYPQLRYWINDGRVNPQPSIDRDGNSKVTQILRMCVVAIAKEKGKTLQLIQTTINERLTLVPAPANFEEYKAFEKTLSDAYIFNWLVGKKLRMKDSTGVMDGRAWVRSDIAEIVTN